MNAEETFAMLREAVERQAEIDTVQTWLAAEGIDNEAFAVRLHQIIAAKDDGLPSPFVCLAMGFGLGWEAHKVMLETPIEARPAPDLSDSLE